MLLCMTTTGATGTWRIVTPGEKTWLTDFFDLPLSHECAKSNTLLKTTRLILCHTAERVIVKISCVCNYNRLQISEDALYKQDELTHHNLTTHCCVTQSRNLKFHIMYMGCSMKGAYGLHKRASFCGKGTRPVRKEPGRKGGGGGSKSIHIPKDYTFCYYWIGTDFIAKVCVINKH